MKYLFFSLLLFFQVTAQADLALDLLKASDQRRGGVETGVSWKAKIDSVDEGEASSREFQIKALNEDALAESLTPARNKGEVFIFNGPNMWFFKPSLRKPVAISSRQKLAGQAANGDIASTNYAKNYAPILEKTEEINGDQVAVLMLKAKTSTVTYDKIRYWVSQKSKLAIKADFLTLQGKEFKHATFEYDNQLTVNGEKIKFVSKMTITDAKNQENKSTITYQSPKVDKFSQNIFNVNNLGR